MRNLVGYLASGALALALSAPAMASEGMWTFDNFPIAKANAELGTNIDQAWLDKVRAGAVRLSSGCSASMVSPEGLILTNNHCVVACAQNLSSEGQDYYTTGYYAKTDADEKTCPGMRAEVLTGITDVTAQVTAAGKGLKGEDLVKARTAVTSNLEKDCGDADAYRCEVVTLYHGGQYKLYKYRKYTDVRLVFSPGIAAAFFGGDPDNFNFPRYDLDSAFVRLYEHGKPVATPQHLTWNDSTPKAGEATFIAGNPGGTDRQLTMAQLATQRELTLPVTALQLSELRGRLIEFGKQSAEDKRIAQELLFGLENSFKVYYGRLQALNDTDFMAKKQAEQDALQTKVKALSAAKLPAGFGTPWQTIDQAQQAERALYLPYRFVEGGPIGSDLFDYARTLVRGAEERAKPSADRLPGYADSDLPRVEKDLFAKKPVYPQLEQLLFDFWLTKAREYLTADSPYTKTLLGNDSPEDLAAAFSKSTLADPAVRKKLWDGGMAAIKASNDPLIQYVLRIDPTSRQLLSQWNDRVVGPSTEASEKIAKARFAVYGTSIYPDATFTLRLSYGKIEGWTYRGTQVPPFTYFKGLYERATGKPPFDLDPRWIAAKDKLNPNTVFDISSSNDIIGGNSGSPLINAKGEVIGAVFDGNIHSLGGDYGYDPKLNRSVSVSAAAVNEALRKVYGATRLANELECR